MFNSSVNFCIEYQERGLNLCHEKPVDSQSGAITISPRGTAGRTVIVELPNSLLRCKKGVSRGLK